MTGNNEHQHPTTCIKHLAVSGLSSVSARIKSSCNLTGNRFEMPNVSYTQPLGAINFNKNQKPPHPTICNCVPIQTLSMRVFRVTLLLAFLQFHFLRNSLHLLFCGMFRNYSNSVSGRKKCNYTHHRFCILLLIGCYFQS